MVAYLPSQLAEQTELFMIWHEQMEKYSWMTLHIIRPAKCSCTSDHKQNCKCLEYLFSFLLFLILFLRRYLKVTTDIADKQITFHIYFTHFPEQDDMYD